MGLAEILGTNSETSLPRSNGELVFEKPWESRAFGLAAALAEAGVFNWSDFQASLISAIADRDEAKPYRYYECWLAALEALVVGRGVISKQDLDVLVEDFSKRPHGHDHRHYHVRGHEH